ncbi:MAG: hydantoinase/oxoprolinase family protein [Parvularculaceae bacterium]|nr:hydantoinase/oxoprolinase family protein [Parvularculaceae bacterium]
MATKARLAVDIGGTFTDIALETADGARVTAKVLTTSTAPEEGVIEGVFSALQSAALSPADIGLIIHGTTLATNALIEKRGAVTALLTTEGHRDALEMAYEHRFEQYDITIDRPPPLVPRWLRLPVRERMNAHGEAILPLDVSSVDAILPVLARESVESLAIGFLHSYANPAHEQRVGERVARAAPHLSISLSSDVAPEIREYERQTTTVANAYVRPLMERYLRALEAAFRQRGFSCPFLLVTSGGGLCTVETAARFPVRLVESGPAGGAVLAASVARTLDLEAVLSFDMGGTTAKMCLIDHGAPASARVFEVDRSYRFKKGSGTPLRIPVIELVEIGAGGGSLARVDAMKRVRVGPESAGAEPGPACYARGGVHPAVTDADLMLGRIKASRFANGAILLDEDASARALIAIAEPLGLDGENAAFAVSEVVDENMVAAARAHGVEQGKDIRARVLIAFGGAAPLHAARLAEKLGCQTVIVPQGAGVGSAIGFLLMPAAYEIVRSLPMRLDALDLARVDEMFTAMRREAQAVVRAAAGDVPLTEERFAFMRYAGQGHEIAVSCPPFALGDDKQGSLLMSFEAAYRAIYGRTIPGMAVEAMSWSLKVSAAAPASRAIADTLRPVMRRALDTQSVFDAAERRRLDYQLFDRDALSPGDRIAGPALIVEAQTTTVVTSVFDARIDGAGNIVLDRKAP